MTDSPAATAPAPVVEEVAAPPTPISVEPRTAPAGEAAEIARQAAEAKVAGQEKSGKAEPAKVEDKPKPPATAKDAIRAARERLEAKEAAAEKATPLKTEPAAKAESVAKAAEPAKSEPTRGEDGKFVSTKPAEPTAKAEPAAKVTEDAGKPKVDAAKPSFTAEPAPKRFAKAAQDRWAEAPEEVRSEVARMEKELTAGFEKHRIAAARDADLAEFHEMATKGGTTVKDALTKYIGMENVLRTDFDKGIEAIFQNVGKSPREWAEKLLGQAPDVTASKTDATVNELRNQVSELTKALAGINAERTQAKTDSTTETVTKFAAEHPRFEELSEDIAFFLKTRCPGDLAKAYELAERLNPAAAKEEPKPKEDPASASSATVVELAKPASSAGQKSITGAPTAGSDLARKQPSSSIKEAIRRATSKVA